MTIDPQTRATAEAVNVILEAMAELPHTDRRTVAAWFARQYRELLDLDTIVRQTATPGLALTVEPPAEGQAVYSIAAPTFRDPNRRVSTTVPSPRTGVTA